VERMIYTLIKFARRKEHAEDLQNGLLYMNKLKTFREYRDLDGHLRSDPYEGVIGIFQPDKVKIEFQGTPIDTKSIVAPILVHDKLLLEKYAFCMYSVNSQNWTQVRGEELEQFRSDLAIHEEVYGLGPYATVITDTTMFVQRIRAAMTSKGHSWRLALVEYYDSSAQMGFFDQSLWGFHKRHEFQLLQECRLIIDDLQSTTDGPFMFDVGSLRDISIVTPSAYLKDSLNIDPRE